MNSFLENLSLTMLKKIKFKLRDSETELCFFFKKDTDQYMIFSKYFFYINLHASNIHSIFQVLVALFIFNSNLILHKLRSHFFIRLLA